MDIRLGDRRLKLISANRTITALSGLRMGIHWDNDRQQWQIVSLVRDWGDQVIEVARENGAVGIMVRPKDERQFTMSEIFGGFARGIYDLDRRDHPLSRTEVKLDNLGGYLDMVIDADGLAFFAMYACVETMNDQYCLYLNRSDPLVGGLSAPMGRLIKQFFGS